MEKHTDPNDRATQLEEEARSIAMEKAARRARPEQLPDAQGNYATTECVACGDEIGAARLRVAIRNTHCITCATRLERRR